MIQSHFFVDHNPIRHNDEGSWWCQGSCRRNFGVEEKVGRGILLVQAFGGSIVAK